MKKKINLKYLGPIAGGIVLLAILYFATDRQSQKPAEYPFKACQGELCIYGNQMGKIEDCIVNERQERICGSYVLFVKEGLEIKVSQ